MGIDEGIDEQAVSQHYTSGNLLSLIMQGLEETGVSVEAVGPDDLAAVEEFHIGGREATAWAVDNMSLEPSHQVLDIGCGIGGAARYIAHQTGCAVTGIDLTDEFVKTGQELNRLTGLAGKVTLQTASALDLPFPDQAFDAAITLHAAMNIADRDRLYAEAGRVLRPGAVFCIYDVMKQSEEPLAYPVPWAESAQTSYLTTPAEMEPLLEQAGFVIRSLEDRRDFALNFFEKSLAAMQERMKTGRSALSLNLVMGESAPLKFRNMLENIQQGCISPVQIIAEKAS